MTLGQISFSHDVYFPHPPTHIPFTDSQTHHANPISALSCSQETDSSTTFHYDLSVEGARRYSPRSLSPTALPIFVYCTCVTVIHKPAHHSHLLPLQYTHTHTHTNTTRGNIYCKMWKRKNINKLYLIRILSCELRHDDRIFCGAKSLVLCLYKYIYTYVYMYAVHPRVYNTYMFTKKDFMVVEYKCKSS